ncbi:MAG: hypothetical protein HY763_16055 [Planctomycetes bacterium]|nr:hypothetical protein [Planctomycetota bacterium]
MSEAPYNPQDPLFLLSRAMDEALTPEEQQRLDAALAADPSLHNQADRLREAQELLGRWGAAQPVPEIDWAAFAETVAARAGDPADEGLAAVDRLLVRWGARRAVVDDVRFTAAVMKRVRSRERRTVGRTLLFRIATPLAAAAAIVLAVTTGFWPAGKQTPRSRVTIERVVVGGSRAPLNSDQRVAVVSFDRTSGGVPAVPGVPGISLASIGASPVDDGSAEAPPL